MARKPPTLRFEPDPAIELPRLVDESGTLPPATHAASEAELKGLCNAQTLRAGETISFQSVSKRLSGRFRVSARPGPSNRMPTYLLEPIGDESPGRDLPVVPALLRYGPPVSAPPPTKAGTPWAEGFLVAAEALARDAPTDRLGRHGL
jgi:hypothetical protein